jgi:hypothetical protein
MHLLNTILVLAAVVCGVWVAGSRHLLHWAREMSGWINGDNGPDVLHVICETVKLIVRITIGCYGSHGLLRKVTSIELR